MGKVSPTADAVFQESMALDSKKQSATTKAVKRIGRSMKAQKPKLAAEEKYQRGIILLSHIPYGFFEVEIKKFFSQFGKVKRIRLARSPKTGRSKGYAFIEFEFYEVAQIAAESMNNYLMYERLVKCKILEPKVNTNKIFAAKSIRKNSFPTLFRRTKLIKKLSKPMQEDEIEKADGTRIKCIARNNNKLSALGINYKYDEVDEDCLKKALEFHQKDITKSVTKTLSKKKRKAHTPLTPPIIQKSIEKKKKITLASRTAKPNISPKSMTKEKCQTPEVIKLSPKMKTPSPFPFPLKSISTGQTKVASQPSSNKKDKKSPKFSPKLLRSKTRQSELLTPSVEKTPVPKKVRKFIASVKELCNDEPVAASVVTQRKKEVKKRKSEATVEKPKFSPKFLRSNSKVQQNLQMRGLGPLGKGRGWVACFIDLSQ